MDCILDFQIFKQEDDLIIKELAVKKIYNDYDLTEAYLFKPPFNWDHLPLKYKVENKWLEHHFHNLNWSSGYTEYKELFNIFEDLSKARQVYIDGHEKIRWLSKYLPNLYNFNDLSCSTLTIIKNSLEKNKCKNHLNKNVLNYNCSVHNVNVLKILYDLMIK